MQEFINEPDLLLADEPTGNLDSKSSKKIHKKGKTIVVVTHEKDVANMAKRIITLKDGKVLSDENMR